MRNMRKHKPSCRPIGGPPSLIISNTLHYCAAPGMPGNAPLQDLTCTFNVHTVFQDESPTAVALELWQHSRAFWNLGLGNE